MPLVHVDSEAADLIEAAVTMLEAALSARVKRADPENVISNSLTLQTNKLKSFRAGLRSLPPPPFSAMVEPLQRKALSAAKGLLSAASADDKDAHWRNLVGLVNAAQTPPA